MSSSPSKRKGTAYETEVVRFLQGELGGVFPQIERRVSGPQDRGDIAGIYDWVIEAKNHNGAQWGPWLDETEQEKKNAEARFGLLVVKRRLRPVEQSYAMMTLAQATDLIYLVHRYAG